MNYMKRNLLYAFLLVISFAASVSAEEVKAGEEIENEPEKIGLNISLKYASNYLWRGMYWYEDGAFFPGVSYSHGPFTLSYTGEFSEDAVIDNRPVTKADGSTRVRNLHATDFGLDFSHRFADFITLGTGIWYYLFHNEMDLSYLTATVTFTLSGLPLSPFLAYNHDVYTGHDVKNRAKDFYIQTGINHSIELLNNVALNLGLAGGFYRAKTTSQTGISDIATSAGLNVTLAYVTLYGSFNYVIVPSADFRKLSDGKPDVDRFYAVTGVTCNL